MKNQICNYIEIVPRLKVESISENEWTLKSDVLPIRLAARNGIRYEENTQETDSGTVLNQIVTLSDKTEDWNRDIFSGLKYYFVKVFAPNGTLIVGKIRYPAKKNISKNKSETTLTFTAQSPF